MGELFHGSAISLDHRLCGARVVDLLEYVVDAVIKDNDVPRQQLDRAQPLELLRTRDRRHAIILDPVAVSVVFSEEQLQLAGQGERVGDFAAVDR